MGKYHGWLALDSRWVLFEEGDSLLESDVTVGLNLGKKSKAILQLQASAPQGERAYMALAPAFVFEHKPGHHLEIGLKAGLVDKSSKAIKIGLWRQF